MLRLYPHRAKSKTKLFVRSFIVHVFVIRNKLISLLVFSRFSENSSENYTLRTTACIRWSRLDTSSAVILFAAQLICSCMAFLCFVRSLFEFQNVIQFNTVRFDLENVESNLKLTGKIFTIIALDHGSMLFADYHTQRK